MDRYGAGWKTAIMRKAHSDTVNFKASQMSHNKANKEMMCTLCVARS